MRLQNFTIWEGGVLMVYSSQSAAVLDPFNLLIYSIHWDWVASKAFPLTLGNLWATAWASLLAEAHTETN